MSLILQFVPLEGEVHDFFQPVSTEILRLLQGKDCLPTDPFNSVIAPTNPLKEIIAIVTHANTNDKSNCYDVQWKQPSQLLQVQQEMIYDCIPQSLLALSLKLYYLNSSITKSLSNELCSQLCIRKVNIGHLIAVAEYVLADYLKQEKDSFAHFSIDNDKEVYIDNDESYSDDVDVVDSLILWIARWLACVQCLFEETHNFTSLSSLKKLPIIPLLNGQLVSGDRGPVFFPSESEKGSDYFLLKVLL